MIRRLIDNLFLIWLVLGLGFWLTWVIVAPPYDSGVAAGVTFFGAYTLGVPFLLGTWLMHSLVGPDLTLFHQVLAITLGALPLFFVHRRFVSIRTERQS